MGRKAVYKQLLCRYCLKPIYFMIALGYWIVKEKDGEGNNTFTFKCPKNPSFILRSSLKYPPRSAKSPMLSHASHQPMDNLSYLKWKYDQKNKK